MKLSSRNQLKGKITGIRKGPVSTEVVLDVNGQSVTASITSGSAESMGLEIGNDAVAVIKASSVMIGLE